MVEELYQAAYRRGKFPPLSTALNDILVISYYTRRITNRLKITWVLLNVRNYKNVARLLNDSSFAQKESQTA